MAAAGSLLLDLPDEIIISICNHLDLKAVLLALLVCKRISGLAEPFLYHSIKVLEGRQGSSLTYSFLAQPRRATWVRHFLVSTKLDDVDSLSGLPPFIAQMSNLQDLRLETPDCNKLEPEERLAWVSLQSRYERVFEQSSALLPRDAVRYLPNLKSCTIHFVDGVKAIYLMTKYSALFLLPNLLSLTISCASTDRPKSLWEGLAEDPALVKSTALEHLHLEECDIDTDTLSIILSFPRGLKSLKISEGIRYDYNFLEQGRQLTQVQHRMHGNVCPASFADAITKHCSESLEALSLSLGHYRRRGQHINHYGHHLDLAGFENLRYIETDHRTVNLIRTRPVCDHATWRRLPASLETLRVFAVPLGQRSPFSTTNKAYFPLDTCLFRQKAGHGVAKLTNLIYSYEYTGSEEQILMVSEDGELEQVSQVELAKASILKGCKQLQPLCKQAGIQLRVETTSLPDGFMPPYLYPENQPKTTLLWES